jgi:23S rRNA (uridine2552-2'-O)-methyltransferase
MAKPYKRQDYLYERAKEDQYRSRAAYKLLELDRRYRLLKRGACVLDLGAWPGSWIQVASEKIGTDGLIVGIDLTKIDPLDENDKNRSSITLLQRDITSPDLITELTELITQPIDLILCDISPKLSGIKEVDRARMEECAKAVESITHNLLTPRGNFVIKLFQSPEGDRFARSQAPYFDKIIRAELDSTRKSSTEWYFVGLKFKTNK